MFKLSEKHCYFVVKLCVSFMSLVTVLSFLEPWRGGKHAMPYFKDPEEEEYEHQVQEDEARVVHWLGAGGAPAALRGDARRLAEEAYQRYAINTYLSDLISYTRNLEDFRNPACARIVYDAELPSASVVIIFHNEPYSVVLRTVWSVLNSARRDLPWYKMANFVDREADRTMKIGYPGQDPGSEHVYLQEVILVDDFSSRRELRGKLAHYVRTRLPRGLVRLLRLPERAGLIRARAAGARAARGAVLVFLDAHCEGSPDWLRPLLQRVKDQETAVVLPRIDKIDAKTFQYLINEGPLYVGGFNFDGFFTWSLATEREKKRRGSQTSPIRTPVMAGGLFAMSRAYFWRLGGYDEGMGGWGGENLEISFRVWQCGGTLETVPCSRVGHVFRDFHPYELPAGSDSHGINTARMAEVWMDEYAELFYLHRPDLRGNSIIGDVSARKALRTRLRCRSFRWFLDTVYPDKFVPVRDARAFGRVRNPLTGLCLDTLSRDGWPDVPLGLSPCHSNLNSAQLLSLTRTGQLRADQNCAYVKLDAGGAGGAGRAGRVVMAPCDARAHGQRSWQYSRTSRQLLHAQSGLCVGAGAGAGDARASACGGGAQQWTFDYDSSTDFSELGAPAAAARLRRLRAQAPAAGLQIH